MAGIKVQDFGGRLPVRSPRLLPETFAQEAVNCKLLSGELRGLRALSVEHQFPVDTNPVHVWRVQETGNPSNEAWTFSTVQGAELLKSPLINDAFDRHYLFEPGQPVKVTTFGDIDAATGPYDLNFTHPSVEPTLTPTAGAGTVYDRVYVYTYVTEWGEETIVSPPASVSIDDGGLVVLSNFYPVTPVIAGRDYASVRIYRTVTGAFGAEFFFVADVAWGGTSYNDTALDSVITLNERLTSSTNDTAPDGLSGARPHPSGALVAFRGRDLYFSRPYLPHAWPEDWRLSVPDEIVGVEVFGQNIAVMTKGRPALVYGAEPGAMGLLAYSFSEPCLSYGSIVGMPDGAYYASHQGLVMFTSAGPQNITKPLISEEEWQRDYASDTLTATRYGTQYLAVETTGVGFIIDSIDERVALVDLAGLENFTGITSDIYTGQVYVISGDDVYLWDNYTAPEIDYMWKSKQFMSPKPINLGAVIVHMEPRETAYTPPGSVPAEFPAEYDDITKTDEVLVEVWCNGERIFAGPAQDRRQVRLPSGFKGDMWEFRITGQCRVYSVALTEVGREQAGV